MFRLGGEDRAIFKNLQASLEAAVSRDARLVDLTHRSKRSRVPFIADGDEALAAAVDLVRNRIAAVLSAAG